MPENRKANDFLHTLGPHVTCDQKVEEDKRVFDQQKKNDKDRFKRERYKNVFKLLSEALREGLTFSISKRNLRSGNKK